MNENRASDRFITHPHRLVDLICYLLIFVTAFRRVNELDGAFVISIALALIGLFTLLYASEARLSRRFTAYPHIYFSLQMVLVQVLALFQVYIDAWALLYIPLGFQVASRCSRKAALTWGGLFVAATLVTMCLEFGFVSGFGRALAYIVIGLFIISYAVQYSQHQEALAESQVLLAELQEAHKKLQDYAAQAQALAAAQERNRLIQELYDSVGQKIFAIQLAAEATRLMLEKDPQRAAGQIDDLQEQTQFALGQMRQLIGQWRPG
jgi:signal transduction histidine kinase